MHGSYMECNFIPKVLDGVNLRALCRPVFVTLNFSLWMWLCASRLVEVVKLEQKHFPSSHSAQCLLKLNFSV